jgi:hypothetical protein
VAATVEAHVERLSDIYRWVPQLVAGAVGVTYVVLALVGFSKTGGQPFFGSQGSQVAGIGVNPFQCTINLVIGAGGLVAATRKNWAARYGHVVFLVTLALFILSILLPSYPTHNFIAANGRTSALYLITALVAVW